MAAETLPVTARTRVRRLPDRGHYDRETIYAILDAAFICHVGFLADGKPVVIPTNFGRAGDKLLIHGSAARRMLRSLKEGIDVCVTVTLVDGLVLARSAFHSFGELSFGGDLRQSDAYRRRSREDAGAARDL